MAKRRATTRKRVTKALLNRVMCGDTVAIRELGSLGSVVVPRVLTAFHGPYPPGTHPRDVWENLLWALSLAVERADSAILEGLPFFFHLTG